MAWGLGLPALVSVALIFIALTAPVAPGADAAPIIARQTRWMAAVMTSSDATAFLWRLASY